MALEPLFLDVFISLCPNIRGTAFSMLESTLKCKPKSQIRWFGFGLVRILEFSLGGMSWLHLSYQHCLHCHVDNIDATIGTGQTVDIRRKALWCCTSLFNRYSEILYRSWVICTTFSGHTCDSLNGLLKTLFWKTIVQLWSLKCLSCASFWVKRFAVLSR